LRWGEILIEIAFKFIESQQDLGSHLESALRACHLRAPRHLDDVDVSSDAFEEAASILSVGSRAVEEMTDALRVPTF